ncbi:hypothetical protein NQ646_01300 [Acinetobacter baumannii]|nr:hypothetical protein [Acinetobacter baumannii]
MNQNKKIKKNFRIENELSEEKTDINEINNKLKIEGFKNNKELFIILFELKDLNNDLKNWKKLINNIIVKKPFTNDYKIFNELKFLQKIILIFLRYLIKKNLLMILLKSSY